MDIDLIRKYNVPGPRYTSYPTVPYWDEARLTADVWAQKVKATFDQDPEQGVSLYIHLPYCESLCTYCGCNTRITINHQVEEPYIKTVLKEWDMYLEIFGQQPVIKEIHLGGGTPTFFSPAHLRMLIEGIVSKAKLAPRPEMSFEAHPNSTTVEHMQTLYDLGFRRLSFGIQDFDPEVQKTVNRIQPFEKVKEVTEAARKVGYESVNFDLIYGLPKQTQASVRDTIHKTALLKPDRIAFYSYAHVPWMKPAQRKFEAFLPTNEEKRALYELGKSMLEAHDYYEIGMDHFALPTDSMYKASLNGKLHRNFMGYSTSATKLLIGLGVSAISDTWTAFAQNVKVVEGYMKKVNQGELPVYRGHVLTEEDLLIRQHILNIMCRSKTAWNRQAEAHEVLNQAVPRLQEMAQDQLIQLSDDTITVTPSGKPFIRNVCMALDARMWRKQPETTLFSSTI